MSLSTAELASLETATRAAKAAHADAHNAAFLKGGGDTKGVTSDLTKRWDTLISAYSHLTAGRAAKTAYTAETLIAAMNELCADCNVRARELGFNDKTHADGFALLMKPRRRSREERAEARANRY